MSDSTTDQPPFNLRPVRSSHAKDQWQYDEDELPTDHSVGWALSFGCQLTFGWEGEQLTVTVGTSDHDQRDGITKRAVTPEAVAEYARMLLALVESDSGVVPGTPAATCAVVSGQDYGAVSPAPGDEPQPELDRPCLHGILRGMMVCPACDPEKQAAAEEAARAYADRHQASSVAQEGEQ